MKSILLITCYFGKLPNFFNFYLKSAGYNSTVNFLLVTDDRDKYDYPENVKVLYKSFEEFKKEAQNIFDFPINLDSPYKLCDYKPVYGKIFYEMVKNYDFWGYCDIDLIWGNIRSFLTDEVLNYGYDKIQTAGHFTIMPTCEESINFYKQSVTGYPDYEKVYSSSANFAYDEWPGLAGKYKALGKKIYNEVNDFSDLSFRVKYFLPSEEFFRRKCCDKKWFRKNIVFYYKKGELFVVGIVDKKVDLKQSMYVHFQKRKIKTVCNLNDEFVILPYGKFEGKIPDFTVKYLKKNAKESKINFNYLKIKWKNLLRKLKKK